MMLWKHLARGLQVKDLGATKAIPSYPRSMNELNIGWPANLRIEMP
jgi:hypothetical protein